MLKVVLKPKKKPAPSFVPFIGAVLYIMVVLCILLGIFNSVWFFAVAVFIVLLLICVSRMFSWYMKAEVRQTNEFDVYEITEINDMLGHNKTKYHIYSIRQCVRRGSSIVLYGNMTLYEPLRKGKEVQKCVIKDATDEIFLYFFNKVSR